MSAREIYVKTIKTFTNKALIKKATFRFNPFLENSTETRIALFDSYKTLQKLNPLCMFNVDVVSGNAKPKITFKYDGGKVLEFNMENLISSDVYNYIKDENKSNE
ncbi:hypothetical protein A3Q56_00267 [Intoshia linei]|uniref:Ribosomal protein/NADH dehydrogenase domain-containing protein n=1 Tax=Intoshia linei TaxID=1819745 RepID=A0A177BCP0_9BILA|nr:hypothetical protein A3Q56_00267 [Intoshia linei]